jgi:glycerophosphoryl diester phosphodiesterase
MGKTLIVAHRGASGYEHENTLKAYEKAIKLGADYIECDVRITADNQLVLHHDANVGLRKIKKTSYAVLRTRALKKGYKIPTLQDLVKLAKGKIKLDVEIKVKGIESQVLEVLLKDLNLNDFVITSFLDSVVGNVKLLNKNVRCGLIFSILKGRIKLKNPIFRAINLKADLIAPNFKLINKKFLAAARENNLPIWAWTVNKPKEIQKFLQVFPVEAIITNFPDTAAALRKKVFHAN